MKIYISEKDFDTCGEKIETFNDVDLGLFDSVLNAYDIVETIERGAIITPLEKHDAEIRKPLEEEIKKIKSTRMPASIPDGVALHYKQENAVINKAKQEVINELLEWASYKINDYDTSIPRLEMINSFIKKLSEMKGGR